MKLNESIRLSIKRHSSELKELATLIHDNPETGFKEVQACKWQAEILRKHGFSMKTPHAGMETAYFAKKGKGRPCVCMVAEYDALPDIGHACGHNLICAASIGAAIALAELIEKESLPGSVCVAGTPGEEGMGGKLKFISDNSFKDVDVAIMGHPEFTTSAWNGFLAIERFDVVFHGKASHAAAAPEKGLNALDGVMLLFQGINAWRQHLPEDSRIHGIVLEGGVAPNIVPEMASCRFYLRSSKNSVFNEMEKRFRDIAKGAALMTGTTHKVIKGKEGYKAGLVIETLNDEFIQTASALGFTPSRSAKLGRGSSDFGDLSQTLPGIHYYFRAVKDKIHLHMREFAEQAAAPFALDSILKAAEISANMGYRFITNNKLRDKIKAEFARVKKESDHGDC